MTLPNERTRAVNDARELLFELARGYNRTEFWSTESPKKIKRTMKEWRRLAKIVLRHYPLEFEMERVAKKDGEVFG